MTLLRWPEVTNHQDPLSDLLALAKALFAARQMRRRACRAPGGRSFRRQTAVSSCEPSVVRAIGADDGDSPPHVFGADDISGPISGLWGKTCSSCEGRPQ